MRYGEPVIRRTVPLALAMISTSSPKLQILDTLSKFSHDSDAEVAHNSILAMGLVGAGMSKPQAYLSAADVFFQVLFIYVTDIVVCIIRLLIYFTLCLPLVSCPSIFPSIPGLQCDCFSIYVLDIATVFLSFSIIIFVVLT